MRTKKEIEDQIEGMVEVKKHSYNTEDYGKYDEAIAWIRALEWVLKKAPQETK